MSAKKKIHILSIFTFVVVVAVVVLGAYTRLVHAGLGCPDWPTCYGHIWIPNSEVEIQNANRAFSDTPVETDKTWPEQAHRLFASSLGIFILGIFIFTYIKTTPAARIPALPIFVGVLVGATVLRIFVGHSLDWALLALISAFFGYLYFLNKKNQSSNTALPLKHTALLSGFVILQGWFGMWTVTLNLWPQVVTTHLLGGFTTLTLVWLLIQRTSNKDWCVPLAQFEKVKAIQKIALFSLVIIIVQVALGGWTTSNYAALACIDFPTCHNEWIPDMEFIQGFNFFQHVGPNYLGGIMDNAARTAIHFSHRVGALITTAIVLYLCFKMYISGVLMLQKWSALLFLALAIQVVLGISNIVFGLPLYVAVAHNAGGAFLLLVAVTINYKIITAKVVKA